MRELSAPAKVLVAAATALLTIPLLCSAAGSDTAFDDPVAPVVGAAAFGVPLAGRPGAVAKVVVIGIDGLLYDKADHTQAPRLRHLAAQGLLSRGHIDGHITISGPSWASVLTGVWDTAHGITDNTFDARPFLAHPSVFTRIERADPARHTVSIGTWHQIATIAASGERRADLALTTAPDPRDTDESRTDAATATEVVTAIDRTGPDLVFTHLDQIDLAGHRHGAASRAYLAAVRRTDELVGRIVAAVDRRAAAHPDEQWTVLVTTDHGHLPTGGHGGQRPDETANFVIARGADFTPGTTTGAHTLVDITPTVLDLLGVPPGPLDGHSLRTRPAPADAR
ncbi:alkaline phosphatase family protein [Nocardia neocaledoniensis]|uniref:alkaline phosphatase family protein n=1 Tax=Nocardia neocaledoniensis TaxID=236511 RepID=UPI0024546759|nr:alkaline phosphatase family protein [Nocardia neocaledoniensis]